MTRPQFALFSLLFTALATGQNLQVDDTYTAQQLVENVLLSNSQCASAANFSVSGDTFDGGQNSYAHFTNTNPAFPFTEGVVLSTARAVRSEGPNNNLVDEGNTGWLGDADLQQALGISNTINATALEFDFTPATSQISFDYIFASEEYSGSAPCQYSDGFAFLLKPAGSPGPYQNLAVLPNTNTPVLVTTVHPAIGGCPAINQQYFGGFNNSSYPVNFNGQTIVLTAKANVVPGTVYHIKLVIADEENIRYDSAIFLGAGTFHVGADIGPDRLIAAGNPLCAGEQYALDATQAGATAYAWYKDNVLIPGQTSATYTVSSPGTYRVEVTVGVAGCIATDEAVIEYAPPPVLTDASLAQCDPDHDGSATFNLTLVDNTIIGSSQATDIRYYPTMADALAQTSMIPNPSAFSSTPRTVVARAENQNGCPGFATVTLSIANNAVPAVTSEQCGTGTSGVASFDLNDITASLTQGLPPGMQVSYYTDLADAGSGANPITSTTYQNAVPSLQTIYAVVANGPDCYGSVSVQLVVHTFDPPGFGTEDISICANQPQTIGVAPGFSGYLWNTGDTDHEISVSQAGAYSVTVTDANGCQATKSFHVSASEAAVFDSVTIDDLDNTDNLVTVNYTGIGDYEFSLDGQSFQNGAVFQDVAPDVYSVYIRDRNGCGTTVSPSFYVLSYPRFFTPNGDGFNDVWEIKNLMLRKPDASVIIFDRFGNVLYRFTAGMPGWDGKLRGRDLPATDYWFTLDLGDRSVKGHFSLKR